MKQKILGVKLNCKELHAEMAHMMDANFYGMNSLLALIRSLAASDRRF